MTYKALQGDALRRPAAAVSFGKRARQCLAPTKIMTRSRGLHADFLITGTAAGAVMKRISAFAPSGACAPTCRPPANTVKC
jgi:hypothetical protein